MENEEEVANEALRIIYRGSTEEEDIKMRKKLLRYWPDKPTYQELRRAEELIKNYENKIRFKEETKKRLEERTQRKPLMEGKTKKEKSAVLLRLKKRSITEENPHME